jgi:hypothetical protein
MKPNVRQILLAACTAGALVFAAYSLVDALLMGAAFAGFLMGVVPAFTNKTIPESLLTEVRYWHGKIEEQFSNIDNLLVTIDAHKDWVISPDIINELKGYRDKLQKLNAKCNAGKASPSDRRERSTLLKKTVAYCLRQMKLWAYNQYNEGYMTIEELHDLHFLLPGETGGYHGRGDVTDEMADVKVKVINMDNMKVIIDQANDENAALVRHGWPKGVRQALIVVLSADGAAEVVRKMTTRLHTRIRMPAGSRGKTFIAKAAFLKHIDDEPQFGSLQPTFTMPQTTEDLSAIIAHQQHEEFEEDIRTVEDHRKDVERLEALLREAKKKLQK